MGQGYNFLLLALLPLSLAIQDITSFGAIPKTDTVAAHKANSQAITRAILAANSSHTERSVRIPHGTYYSMPIAVDDIFNISILIEGKLTASNNVTAWPYEEKGSMQKAHFLKFTDSSYVQISGGGRIDGRGYKWWLLEWLRIKRYWPNGSRRPKLIMIEGCQYFKIHDLILKNSPSFHIATHYCEHFEIYNLDIKVNTTAQFNLAKRFSLEGVIPDFPLNTDGIDPAGRYFRIWNLTVQNFDDVVVPKPSHKGGIIDCTQFMHVENITVKFGVGLSIGSVPPNKDHNCIRNITFRNAVFQKPLKGIYVKTNPGEEGSGQIKNIVYENMVLNEPIWWAIYIGPQQQKQPNGNGPGCMLYPHDPKGTCQTQPRIDVENITLENITIYNSLLFPIIVRCNETNPCKGINFLNVKTDKWRIGKSSKGYICENSQGIQSGGHPRLDCLTENTSIRRNLLEKGPETGQTGLEMARQMWKALEKAVEEIPYVQEDDQMEKISQLLQLDS